MNLSCLCQIQILNFGIYFYPIKMSEFFKIHFNLYEGIKIKQFLFFSTRKICRPLIHFNLSRGIETKWFLLFKSKKKVTRVIQFILIHNIGLKWCKCNFFNPYFVQMNENELKFSIHFNLFLFTGFRSKINFYFI